MQVHEETEGENGTKGRTGDSLVKGVLKGTLNLPERGP